MNIQNEMQTIDRNLVTKCLSAAHEMRLDALKMTYNVGSTGAHIGGALSMIEIMAALYVGVMTYEINDKQWEGRDRFILSKGHGVMAQYAAMKQIGILTDEDLLTFKKNTTCLFAHPSINMDLGIEFSSGSLGQGLSLGVGTALALKRKGNSKSHVYVLVGDGECDEGSIWEAAASAAHFKLDNLTMIIDKNGLQYDGKTDIILSMDNLTEKMSAFGWNTINTDGHSVQALIASLKVRDNKPVAIIAHTVKGKGVSFMENNPLWHNGRLTEQQFEQALAEQGVQK